MGNIQKAGKYAGELVAKEAKKDALFLTKFYLTGFRSQEQYVKNLAENINDRYETSITPMYGEHIGHSSAPKMELGAKLADSSLHQQQKADYIKAKHLAEQIKTAIDGLPKAEKVIMQHRYINNTKTPWDIVSGIVGYERRNCMYLHDKGLRSVAICLFGITDVLKVEKYKEDKMNRQHML